MAKKRKKKKVIDLGAEAKKAEAQYQELIKSGLSPDEAAQKLVDSGFPENTVKLVTKKSVGGDPMIEALMKQRAAEKKQALTPEERREAREEIIPNLTSMEAPGPSQEELAKRAKEKIQKYWSDEAVAERYKGDLQKDIDAVYDVIEDYSVKPPTKPEPQHPAAEWERKHPSLSTIRPRREPQDIGEAMAQSDVESALLTEEQIRKARLARQEQPIKEAMGKAAPAQEQKKPKSELDRRAQWQARWDELKEYQKSEEWQQEARRRAGHELPQELEPILMSPGERRARAAQSAAEEKKMRAEGWIGPERRAQLLRRGEALPQQQFPGGEALPGQIGGSMVGPERRQLSEQEMDPEIQGWRKALSMVMDKERYVTKSGEVIPPSAEARSAAREDLAKQLAWAPAERRLELTRALRSVYPTDEHPDVRTKRDKILNRINAAQSDEERSGLLKALELLDTKVAPAYEKKPEQSALPTAGPALAMASEEPQPAPEPAPPEPVPPELPQPVPPEEPQPAPGPEEPQPAPPPQEPQMTAGMGGSAFGTAAQALAGAQIGAPQARMGEAEAQRALHSMSDADMSDLIEKVPNWNTLSPAQMMEQYQAAVEQERAQRQPTIGPQGQPILPREVKPEPTPEQAAAQKATADEVRKYVDAFGATPGITSKAVSKAYQHAAGTAGGIIEDVQGAAQEMRGAISESRLSELQGKIASGQATPEEVQELHQGAAIETADVERERKELTQELVRKTQEMDKIYADIEADVIDPAEFWFGPETEGELLTPEEREQMAVERARAEGRSLTDAELKAATAKMPERGEAKRDKWYTIFGRIAEVVGAMFISYASGLVGKDPAAGLRLLNASIDADISRQQKEIGKRTGVAKERLSALKLSRGIYADQVSQRLAARNIMLSQVAKTLSANKDKLDPRMQKNADYLLLGISKEMNKNAKTIFEAEAKAGTVAIQARRLEIAMRQEGRRTRAEERIELAQNIPGTEHVDPNNPYPLTAPQRKQYMEGRAQSETLLQVVDQLVGLTEKIHQYDWGEETGLNPNDVALLKAISDSQLGLAAFGYGGYINLPEVTQLFNKIPELHEALALQSELLTTYKEYKNMGANFTGAEQQMIMAVIGGVPGEPGYFRKLQSASKILLRQHSVLTKQYGRIDKEITNDNYEVRPEKYKSGGKWKDWDERAGKAGVLGEGAQKAYRMFVNLIDEAVKSYRESSGLERTPGESVYRSYISPSGKFVEEGKNPDVRRGKHSGERPFTDDD